MKTLNLSKLPTYRKAWYKYYADVFNKTGCPQAEHLALWYFLLDHADLNK